MKQTSDRKRAMQVRVSAKYKEYQILKAHSQEFGESNQIAASMQTLSNKVKCRVTSPDTASTEGTFHSHFLETVTSMLGKFILRENCPIFFLEPFKVNSQFCRDITKQCFTLSSMVALSRYLRHSSCFFGCSR